MKTFFILGRNPELSRLEVLSFLEARDITHKEVLFIDNILILELSKSEQPSIQEFGGVLKLGPISFEGNEKEFEDWAKNHEFIPADKFSYQVFGNKDPEPIKQQCKSMRKKAVLKSTGNRITYQDGHVENLARTDYSLLFYEQKKTVYFGLATQNYDYRQVQIRDMEKPTRREALAISPRLSKILINLGGATPKTTLLDPFCGVGAILMESLIKGISCHGIDIDDNAINAAKENIKWLHERYPINAGHRIEQRNAKRSPDRQFGSIATETPLGEVLRKKPSQTQAKSIIAKFEHFVIPVLQHLKEVKSKNAKIAITFPVVNGLHVPAQTIAKKADLKILHGPILESRADQFVSRDIMVFQ